MIKIILLLLASLPLLGQNEWHSFTNETPVFHINFPGEYQVKEKLIETEVGETLVTTIYSVSSVESSDNLLYLVNFFKLSGSVFNDSLTRCEYLELMVDGIREETGGKSIYQSECSNENAPSIVYRLENEAKGTVAKGKIIYRNEMIYSIQVFTEKKYFLNRNIDRFIDSLYLR
jgi:hypothetical protein